MSMNPFPPSAMASETTNSNTGSPGPSVQYEELSYKIEQRSKFEASPNAEIERLRRELHESRQRIDRDTSVINALHDKVTELEELVKKQKITISTQSKAISDRRVLRKNQQQQQNQQPQSPMGPAMGAGMGMFPITPSSHHQQQHNVHQSQYLGSGASGASAGSIGAGTASVSAGGIVFIQSTSSPFEMQRQAQTPQSVKSFDPITQFNTVFDQPPPKFEISAGPSYTAYTPAVPSGLAPNLERGPDVFDPMGSITIANMTGPAHSATSLGAANYHKDMANFSTRFLGLMRMAEVFGQTHASLPNVFLDSRLDDHVKDYLMAVSSRTQASILIGNASTRSFFVARAINWYLVEKILKIGIIRGLDAAVDMEIGEMQKQIASDTSIGIRHLMLNAIANHLKSLSRRSDFSGFAKKKIHHHATKLWSVIGPLGHDSANQNNMWTDLHAIITEAHCLAIEMYSVPLEYRFELPEHNEPFDPFTMINRDPYIHGDPQILQNGDARVRLAITPTVRIRNNSQSPGEVHLMYLGHVLLKVSRTQ